MAFMSLYGNRSIIGEPTDFDSAIDGADSSAYDVSSTTPSITDTAGTTGATGALAAATQTGQTSAPLRLDRSVYSMSPLQKAMYYNALTSRGYSDAAIRAAAGQQTDEDWATLLDLATGLKSSKPSGALASLGAVPSSGAGAAKAVASKPQELLKSAFASDPKFAERLAASRQQAYDLGEASSYNDPGEKYGEYTVRALPTSFDFEGKPIGGGYTASTSYTAASGKPVETTLTYDDNGNIMGSEVRVFTGGDSGVVYYYDEAGNLIGKPKGFDYSESWKGTVGSLFSMVAPGLGPYGMLANAIFQASQGNTLGALASVAGAGAGFAGGFDLGTGAMTTPGGTLAGISQGTFQNIAAGANAANALKSGNWAGALSSIAGSQLGVDALDIPLGTTGFTLADAAKGASALMAIENGQYGQALTSLGQLAGSQDAIIAGRAATLLQAIQSNNIGAVTNAVQQLSSSLADRGTKASDTGSAAYVAAKNAGATDSEAVAVANQMTGKGDAIDQATAKATGIPVTQMAIPDIEIVDESWGNLTGAMKEAADKNTMKIGASEANTPQEAAALAQSKGFGVFTFGGNTYTIGASADQVLAAAGLAEQAKQTTGTTTQGGAKIVPGWGREGNLIEGFNNATVGSFNQSKAAEILKEYYGTSLDWVDQNVINAAASYIFANREDLLRKDLSEGKELGVGKYNVVTPQDVTSVAKDYVVEGGARVAGPSETGGAVGYDANGVPVAVVQQTTTTAKKMTDEERARYDYEQNLAAAREVIDPMTGRPYATDPATGKEYTFEDYQSSKGVRDLLQGVTAPVLKGLGELGQLAGYLTGSEALTQKAADLEALGRSITPQIVREGTQNLIKDIQNAEGITNKGKAIVNAFVDRPWETLAAVGDLTGTELVQEVLPFSASFAAGKGVNAALKARFGEMVAERAGIVSGVAANASSDALEAGLQSAQQVYNELRSQGFGHDRASEMALKAGLASAVVETVASVVGEGPIMSSLVKGVPGGVARTTVREGVSEFPAGFLQTAIGDVATSRTGTYDPNAALTGGYLETLAGGPTSGTIQAGGNVLSGATTASTTGATASTTGATAPTAGATTPAAATTPGIVESTTTVNQPGTTGVVGQPEITETVTTPDAASIINDYVSVVLQGGDASTAAGATVDSAVNAAVTAGADVSQAASSAVSSTINAAAATGGNVAAVTSSSVSSAVNAATTAGADVAATVTSTVNSAITAAVNSGTSITTAVNSAVTGAVTAAVNSAATTGTDVSTAITNTVNSAVSTAINTAVTTGTNVNTAVNSAVTSAVTAAINTAVNTGQNVSTATNTAVNSAIATAVNTAVNTGQNVNTAVSTAVNSAVNAAVNTGVNVNVAVTAAVTALTKIGIDQPTATKLVVNSLLPGDITTTDTPTTTAPPKTTTPSTTTTTPTQTTTPVKTAGTYIPPVVEAPSYPYTPTSPKETWTGGMFRQNIPAAPNLATLAALFGMLPQQQEFEALSALQRASGVTPARSDYFSYGSEPSPSEVISTYRKGGNVQNGGSGDKMLSSPLMAAVGGDVPHKGSHYVQGAGGGQDDLIPAKLADGEYVFDAEIVAALGDGSNKEGAKKLDAMREAIRKHKRSGSTKTIPPMAKSPLQYLKEATK